MDATKNCIYYGIFIFGVKLTELAFFDFDYIRAVALINFFLPNAALIGVNTVIGLNEDNHRDVHSLMLAVLNS